jgi:hypothetical protein
LTTTLGTGSTGRRGLGAAWPDEMNEINGIGKVVKAKEIRMTIERALRRRGAGVRWVRDELDIIILSRVGHL